MDAPTTPSPRPTLTLAVFNEASGWILPDAHVQRLREKLPDVEIRAVGDRAQLLKALPSTDYLVGLPITDEEFEQHGGRLQWIQLTAAASEMILSMTNVLASPVRITTAAPIQAPQRSEHAIMLLLALLRRLPQTIAAQQEHQWISREVSPQLTDLEGKTVGILGMTAVGRAIARRLQPFGVEILATHGDGENQFLPAASLLPPSRLDELLNRSDVIIVALPLSAGGAALLDRAMLTHIKQGAVLINVSRGRAVDEEALIDALDRGQIAGAGLDAFAQTPLSETSPLWRMANVIVTPQIGGVSPRYWERATDVVIENLRRLRSGRPLLDELIRG